MKLKNLFKIDNVAIRQQSYISCVDINECVETPFICEDPVKYCINTIGSYNCKCKQGYILSATDGSCIDIDECALNPCKVNQTCLNSVGGYNCVCKEYYKNDTGQCIFEVNRKLSFIKIKFFKINSYSFDQKRSFSNKISFAFQKYNLH